MKKIQLNLFFGLFLVTLASVFIYSCSKEATIVDPFKISDEQKLTSCDNTIVQTELEYDIKYFLDGNIVNSISIDTTQDNWVLLLAKEAINNKIPIEIRKFSTKLDFVNYGILNNIPIGKGLDIGSHLNNYAITSGALAYYNINNSVPSTYTTYEEEYYNSHMYNAKNSSQGPRNLWTQMWKECKSSSTISMFKTFPFMPPTWNNKVSKHEVVGFYAGVSIYDKYFYKNHLITIWSSGLSPICYSGLFFDDRMSSALQLL